MPNVSRLEVVSTGARRHGIFEGEAADRCRVLRRAAIGVGNGAAQRIVCEPIVHVSLAREDRLSGVAVPALVPVDPSLLTMTMFEVWPASAVKPPG